MKKNIDVKSLDGKYGTRPADELLKDYREE